VLPSRVDVSVLRVLRDVCQVDTGLLRLGRTTVSGMHIPDGTGDAGSISNLSVEIPIVPTSDGHAAIVSYQGPRRSRQGTPASAICNNGYAVTS
jgi:hypothetical protein